jgi:hypothetical protein
MYDAGVKDFYLFSLSSIHFVTATMRATMVLYGKYYSIISTNAKRGINTRVALCHLRIAGRLSTYGVLFHMEYLHNVFKSILQSYLTEAKSTPLIPSKSPIATSRRLSFSADRVALQAVSTKICEFVEVAWEKLAGYMDGHGVLNIEGKLSHITQQLHLWSGDISNIPSH